MKRRVVITGLGLITPIGLGRQAFWKATQSGENGIGPVTRFDASRLATQIAAEVKGFEPTDFIDKKSVRRMDRFSQLGVAAARLAIEDSGLNLGQEDRNRIGVWVGSGIGGIETYDQQHRVLLERGPARVNPFFIPMLISNMVGSQIAIEFGLKATNSCIVSACATATNAIGEALRILQRGEAEVMLAGGSEAAITELAFAGFCAMRAMSTRNSEPNKASRPFDKDRDGFVMGEGAGVLILETLEHAIKRNATVYAELVGYATNCDAYHIVQPDPEGLGAMRAMQEALKDSNCLPEDVEYINAHGTSTDLNDQMETKAIKTVFGDQARKLAVSSTKSMTGHLLGASGAVELIASALAITNQWLPPTINYENPDPDCDLDYVPNQGRDSQIRYALSNSFGFGGHNATVVIRRWEES
jgi:3-oxoacyl-[acyl-carrier-protein] synthase II